MHRHLASEIEPQVGTDLHSRLALARRRGVLRRDGGAAHRWQAVCRAVVLQNSLRSTSPESLTRTGRKTRTQ
eukprot:5894935-Prymnesium_polylepis.1